MYLVFSGQDGMQVTSLHCIEDCVSLKLTVLMLNSWRNFF